MSITTGELPDNGEGNLMEFYRVKMFPPFLPCAGGTNTAHKAKWNTKRTSKSSLE